VVYGVITSGAESDLEMVTRVARSMVGRWGMSERIGAVSVLSADGDPRMMGVSDAMLAAVDEEVRRLVEECYAEARRLVREHRPQLDRIVEQLLARETLDEAEVYAAAGIEKPPAPAGTDRTMAAASRPTP
jgi:cell division protease FtsH